MTARNIFIVNVGWLGRLVLSLVNRVCQIMFDRECDVQLDL